MSLTFLTEFMVPVIVGICLCVGYVLKNLIPTDKVNRFIPLIMAVIGLFLAVWINKWSISPQIMLSGLFSGLASTGLYEAFRNIVDKNGGITYEDKQSRT